jgi:nucleotide-binding universal stress UspA family protein
MQAFRRILFPTDFSRATIALAPFVREMAQRFDAHVTVLNAFNLVREYVLGPPLGDSCESEPTAIPYAAALLELRKERRKKLDEFAEAHLAGVRHSPRLEDGDPAGVIEFVAQRENADLIMMPTRGIGRFRRLLLGSVTAKVLHDTQRPVFTSAHEPDPQLPLHSAYRCILCAVELNQEADAVLEASSFLARAYGAKLIAVHMEAPSSPTQVAQDAAGWIRQALDRVSRTATGESRLEPKVRVADAGLPEGIWRVAREENADLVLVGRGHQKGDFSRMWSHLFTIIRGSPCPVLSV